MIALCASVLIRDLCRELWPALPWLPTVPGEDNARCTVRSVVAGRPMC